jgi:copper transport protein
VTAELPERGIEPIELEATDAGPGYYVISGAALAVEGVWTVEITPRVSDFDEFRRKLQVPIR